MIKMVMMVLDRCACVCGWGGKDGGGNKLGAPSGVGDGTVIVAIGCGE